MDIRNRLSIVTQLGLLPILAFAGFLAIVMLDYTSLSTLSDASADNANKIEEMKLTRRIQSELTLARLEQQRFLVANNTKPMDAYSQHISVARNDIARLIQTAAADPSTREAATELMAIVDTYEAQFRDMADEALAIGLTLHTGLSHDLHQAADTIETELGGYIASLTVDLLQLRRREKDFLLLQDQQSLDHWEKSVSSFQDSLKSSYLIPALKRDEVLAVVDTYKTVFGKLAAHKFDLIQDQIAVSNTSELLHRNSSSLYEDIAQKVSRSMSNAEHLESRTFRILLAFTVLIGSLVFIAARLIGSNLERSVSELGEAMHELADGTVSTDLQVTQYQNEFGIMSKALTVFKKHELERRAIVSQLRQSKNRVENVISSMNEALFDLDREGKVLFANPAAEKLFGARSGDFYGYPLKELFLESEDVKSPTSDSLLLLKSGFEHLQQNSPTELRSIMDSAPLTLLTVGPDQIIIYANAMASQVLGYPIDVLVGMHINKLIPAKLHAGHGQHVAKFLSVSRPSELGKTGGLPVVGADGQVLEMAFGLIPLLVGGETQIVCVAQRVGVDPALESLGETPFGELFAGLKVNKNLFDIIKLGSLDKTGWHIMSDFAGRRFPVEMSANLLRDENDAVIGATCVVKDISERVKFEKEVRKFRSTLDSTKAAVFMFRPDTLQFLYMNKEATRQTGWSEEVYPTKTPSDINPVFNEERFRMMASPLVSGKQRAVSIETTGLDRAPVELHLELFDMGTDDERFVITVHDISDRVTAQRSMAQFKRTLDQTKDAVFMFAPDTLKYFYVNQSAVDITGISEREFMDLTPMDIADGFDLATFRERTKPLVFGTENSITYEVVLNSKSRGLVPAEASLQIIEPKGEAPRFVAIVRDISERKESEQRIEQLNKTLDQSADEIYIVEQDSFKFLYQNTAARKISGWSTHEYLAESLSDDYPGFDMQEFEREIEPLLDGTRISVTYEREGLQETPLEITVQLVKLLGTKPRLIIFARNVSERKAAETAKAEFLSTVSHELRTPLTSIKGSLGLIQAGAGGALSEKTQKLVTIAHQNSDRLVRLINDILDIDKSESGKMDLDLVPTDLADLVQEAVIANAGYGAAHGIDIAYIPPAATFPVLCDQDRIMQVMANLLSNAIKFSKTGENVVVSVEAKGGKARVSVSDTGLGIPKDAQASIFDKFTQVDSSDRRSKGGSGLGLNIARLMVQAQGGSIDFVSELGVGTTFYFDLQMTDAPDEPSTLDFADDLALPKILVCEDDPDVANILKMTLENAQYDVVISKTARSALIQLSRHHFDAMTLDLGLPDNDGLSLLRKIRKRAELEKLPVIIVSANAKNRKKELVGSGVAVVDWMQKPINNAHLVNLLKTELKGYQGEKPAILHIEDDAHIRDLVQSIVSDSASICSAQSVDEAKFKLGKKKFDLVILDLNLPDGAGQELLPYLNLPPQNGTPVLVFSAQEVTPDEVRKVNAVLVKSKVTNVRLLETIDTLIKNKALQASTAAE